MDEIKRKKVTIPYLQGKKKKGESITMAGFGDYPNAVAADRAGLDIACVSDATSMTLFGRDTTLTVPYEEELTMVQAVARGIKYALIMADMPYMSYHLSKEQAIKNASRFVSEGRADVMKCEATKHIAGNIEAIIKVGGIPVMGHIGLTPMREVQMGGFRAIGTTAEEAKALIEDAYIMQEIGCFALLLEVVPQELAKIITDKLSIPVISLGAGPYCDGVHIIAGDMLRIHDGYVPKHSKVYANLLETMENVYKAYRDDVVTTKYPEANHSVSMKPGEHERLMEILK